MSIENGLKNVDIISKLYTTEKAEHENTRKKLKESELKIIELHYKSAQRTKSIEQRIEDLELTVKQMKDILSNHSRVVNFNTPLM